MCEVCLGDVCVWSMNNRTKKKSAELIELQSWTKQNGKFQPVQMKDGKMARFVVRGFNLDFVGAMRCLFQAVPFYSVQDCNRYILNKINGQFRNLSTLPRGGGGVLSVSKILDLKLIPLYL